MALQFVGGLAIVCANEQMNLIRLLLRLLKIIIKIKS